MRGILVVLLLVVGALGQNAQLTVRVEDSNRSAGLQGGAAGLILAAPRSHGQRFLYIDSSGLPLKETKARYSKKDLEKLEASGVHVTVTSAPDPNVRVEVKQ